MSENNSHKTAIPKSILFLPKLLTTLKDYSYKLFIRDLTSGVIVGIVALPLAIAFAIASGVNPSRGLVASIIGGFLISALGGSRVQIGGTTGAFVVVVTHVVGLYGISGLMACTFLAGLFLVLMGLLRLGAIIKFIPYPLKVGFTAGVAILIATSQIKDFLGLKTVALPADFFQKWVLYFTSIKTLHVPTLLTGVFSMGLLIIWPKITRKIPGAIVVILLSTFVVHFFHLSVPTIGVTLESVISKPAWITLHLKDLKQLLSPAFTIAILGAIQSLLSATVVDTLVEGRHRSNTELIAQGISNLVVPFFGGLPTTGAVARTLTNAKSGGTTPIAGIVHSLFLFLVIFLFGKWIPMIPLPALAAILLMVCYHMGQWHAFIALFKAPRMDIAVLLTTFLITIFIDLTTAIEIGLLISLVLFMKRMTDVTSFKEIRTEIKKGLELPHGVVVYELEGALFFGVAELLRDNLDMGTKSPKVIILKMKHVLALDATGLQALTDLFVKCRQRKTKLLLSGVHSQPLDAMHRSGFLEKVGKENVIENFNEALNKAQSLTETKT